jgi:hypothetical protein
MKGLRSRAQRHQGSQFVRNSFAAANILKRKAALGRRLQLPTDKAALRTEADRLVAEYNQRRALPNRNT